MRFAYADPPYINQAKVLDRCKLWTGALDWDGYGRMTGNRRAHRVIWEEANGPIPEGMLVLHQCDVRRCVNLSHLYVGTHQNNTDDMWKRGRASIHGSVGESHPNCKLSNRQVTEIRHKYSRSGSSDKQLAREYGVSRSQIYRIVHSTQRTDIAS